VNPAALLRPANPAATALLNNAVKKNEVQTVQSLIGQGADVNAKNEHGWPPLALAASDGNVEVVRLLIQAGAAVDATEGENGGTALFWAAFDGHPEVVKVLLDDKADPNSKSNNGTSPLMATTLEHYPKTATQESYVQVAELLLAGGANVNESDKAGMTPRGSAASNNFLKLANLLKQHGGKCTTSPGVVPHNCRD